MTPFVALFDLAMALAASGLGCMLAAIAWCLVLDLMELRARRPR